MANPLLFIQDLTIFDFAYFHPQKGLCGESWRVNISLGGALDHRGFILDFGVAKKRVKAWIDDEFDHRCLIPAAMALAGPATELRLVADTERGKFSYAAPAQAYATHPGLELDPKSLALEWAEKIRSRLPESITAIRFELLPAKELDSQAAYSYTHGLRFHEGNCQRLWHGHRNPIEVWLDNQRLPEAENWLATEFADRHFIHADILQNRAELDLSLGVQAVGDLRSAQLAYRSPQGDFSAEMPVGTLVILDTEPSIENIALFTKKWLAQKRGIDAQIKCFEGLNKGAWSN